jgi:hypothetical protein
MMSAVRKERTTMKVYLAAGYERREEIREYAAQARSKGIEVTSRWLDGPEMRFEEVGAGERTIRALEDLDDVRAADVLVAFTIERGSATTAGGGRHVELGYALALRKLVRVVGPSENVFCHTPGVLRHATWDECLARILGHDAVNVHGGDYAGPSSRSSAGGRHAS